MESSAPATSNFGSLARNITKILRFRRNTTTCSNLDNANYKLKPSKTVEEYPSVLSGPLDYSGESGDKVEDEKQQQPEATPSNREAMESLLANLFASLSAVKAAYAEMQVAQSPYDPETIQSSDQAVVSELKHLSELKQSYFKDQFSPLPSPPVAAQIQEHSNLLKTYNITFKKLESDIQTKVTEITNLQSQLTESDHQNRSLESRLHPERTLSCLDNLHLSSLDPNHFLTLVRYAVRSIRSFAKLMMHKMESAGWDLDAAAAASIHPEVQERPNHLAFALESFVCQTMFSGFQDRNFGLSSLGDLSSWEQQQFFAQFNDLKSVELKQFLASPKGVSSRLGKFCRAKYLSLVHPKMEASFFGNLDQRELISSGRGFPETELFSAFAEMVRRVWLMHCLFFSYGREMEASIFQMRRGCRFSEVYMESVAGGEVCGNGVRPTVGFTVVPGFIVGKTVVQCKVYYISGEAASVWS